MLVSLAAVLAQFLDPEEGPAQGGDFELSPTPFIAMILIGFVVGAVGHLFRSKTLVAIGILLITLATLFLPVYFAVSR